MFKAPDLSPILERYNLNLELEWRQSGLHEGLNDTPYGVKGRETDCCPNCDLEPNGHIFHVFLLITCCDSTLQSSSRIFLTIGYVTGSGMSRARAPYESTSERYGRMSDEENDVEPVKFARSGWRVVFALK
jgi:hypothetical protein